jgi:hypothetical protein
MSSPDLGSSIEAVTLADRCNTSARRHKFHIAVQERPGEAKILIRVKGFIMVRPERIELPTSWFVAISRVL